MVLAAEALRRLREGNRRFVSGARKGASLADQARRRELVAGQAPFAVILGCADSRVPAEIVFDQGLGDLFVVRVAGNVAAPSQIGSIEFAAEQLGARLVVVLGHSRCGAVAATLEAVRRPATTASSHLRAILDRIRPAVEALPGVAGGAAGDAVLEQAVRANVLRTVACLHEDSGTLARLVRTDGLVIVGAEYAIETGSVEFFEGVPETG